MGSHSSCESFFRHANCAWKIVLMRKTKKSFYFEDYKETDISSINNLIKIKISVNRVIFLSFIFLSLIIIFGIKIIYLSLYPSKDFYSSAIKKEFEKTRRDIIDRNGSVLATNVILYDVGVRPELLKKKEKKNLLIKLGILYPELNLKEIKLKL